MRLRAEGQIPLRRMALLSLRSAWPPRLGDPELDSLAFREPDLAVYDQLVPTRMTRDPRAGALTRHRCMGRRAPITELLLGTLGTPKRSNRVVSRSQAVECSRSSLRITVRFRPLGSVCVRFRPVLLRVRFPAPPLSTQPHGWVFLCGVPRAPGRGPGASSQARGFTLGPLGTLVHANADIRFRPFASILVRLQADAPRLSLPDFRCRRRRMPDPWGPREKIDEAWISAIQRRGSSVRAARWPKPRKSRLSGGRSERGY